MTLKEFFIDETISIPYKLFGKTHLFLMLFVIFAFLLIYLNRKKIYNLPIKYKKVITKTLAIILLLNMITLYISQFYYHNFDYQTMLPLHLCYISNYFYIYVILFNKENLYKYSYFLTVLGPLQAIIFFDVPSVWESFNFYLYVISHHFLIIGGFLTFYMYPQKVTLKDIRNLIIALGIMYIFMIIFNAIFNTNYFFSGGIPLFIIDLFPFLKYIPTVLILAFIVTLTFVILYNFYNLEERKFKQV